MSNEIKDQIMEQQVEEVQEQPAPDVQQEVDQAQLDPGITVKTGDIVEGKVVKIEDTQVFVDIGYKYDGIIPIRELFRPSYRQCR